MLENFLNEENNDSEKESENNEDLNNQKKTPNNNSNNYSKNLFDNNIDDNLNDSEEISKENKKSKKNISNETSRKSSNKNLIKTDENEIINNNNFEKVNYIDTNEYYMEYIKENRKGYENIKEKNYFTGLNCYEKCYEISKNNLKDKVKQIDSLINKSICNVFNRNYEDSIKDLELSEKIYNSINKSDISQRIYTHLGLKLYTNFCMSNMAFNKTKEAINNINLIERLIKNESYEKQESYLKSIIYTLFRVNSLLNSDSIEIGNINNKKIIIHIMKGFQHFLKEKNYEILSTCFKEAMNKYKENKDNNGYFFSMFYYNISLYHKGKLSDKEIEEIKKQITMCNENLISIDLINEVKQKDFYVIMKEFKDKADASIAIFHSLINLENEIREKLKENINKSEDDLSHSKILDKSHIFTDEKISSPFIVQLLLKYSLKVLKEQNDINNITRTLNNELNYLLQKIQKNDIDISEIKLQFLDPELINSLKQLFDNLVYIFCKYILRNSFAKLRKVISLKIRKENEKQIKNFLSSNFMKINDGDILKKINFNSTGIKNHYYKLNEGNFEIRNNKEDKKVKKKLNINTNIIKFMYGFSSQRIKKKIIIKEDDKEFLKLTNSPWKFFSIITKERSIDLFCEDNQINNWFYGFKYYLNNNNMSYKIISVNNFVLTKMKFKIVEKMRKNYQNDKLKKSDNTIQQIVKDLCREKGIQNISFCKIMLLYHKIIENEIK